MAQISFYKDAGTGRWVVDKYRPVPGTYKLIQYADGIELYCADGQFPSGNFKYVDILDSTGIAYGTKAAFDAATIEFFSVASGGSQIKEFNVEITRPANTTVYTSGDVLGDVATIYGILSNVAKAVGSGIKIIGARIQTNDTGFGSGSKINIHVYSDVPDMTGITENGALVLSYTNAPKYKGCIPVVMNGSKGQNDWTNLVLNPATKNVYFILETVSGGTPSASGTKFTISLNCELSNN